MIRQLALTVITLFAITVSNAQSVGINTDNSQPNSSAMLDVKSTNKGFLPPRVSLTSTADVTTVTSPANGLLVYNTNTSITNGTGIGFYYYNGTRWVPCGQDNTIVIQGTWTVKNIEQELYSGNTFTGKQFTNPTGNTFAFNANGSYTSVYQSNPPETGTWELLSPTYLVLDKNTANQRFYNIVSLDNKSFVFRGPFDTNGRVISSLGYVLTNFYSK